MDINEISKILNVGKNTLLSWEQHFKLDIKRNSKGKRFYTDEDLKILQTIKALRDNDNGINTITRMLNDELSEIHRNREVEKDDNFQYEYEYDYSSEEGLNMNSPDFYEPQPENLSKAPSNKHLIAYIDDKMDNVIELSEKYSKACYEIGKLQAELNAFKEKMDIMHENFEKDIAVLKKDIEKKDYELMQKSKENDDIRRKLEYNQSEFAKAKKKTLWEKLSGKVNYSLNT